ncbi:DUF2764 family protein [candidate division KSB1 bacterium]|nr:DUF2764 family protein [candidate division KSB1 bacterium]
MLNKVSRKYYCFVAGLPDIELEDDRTSYSLLDLKNDLNESLVKADIDLVNWLFYPVDNQNLLNLLQGKDVNFDPLGVFPKLLLEAQIENPTAVPAYMREFIIGFKKENPTIPGKIPEDRLNEMFYDQALKLENAFLREWFEFELNLRNLLTAINCKKYNIDPANKIIGGKNFAHQLLTNKTRDFGLTADEIENLDQINRIAESKNILDKELFLARFKLGWLEEKVFFYYFSVEKIMSFILRMQIVERLIKLDKNAGREMLKKIINDTKSNFVFSEEFSLK